MITVTHKRGSGCILFGRALVLGWAGSYSWGTWWVGAGRFRLILKAPWNAPMFSERYGYTRYMPLGFGWRVTARMVEVF